MMDWLAQVTGGSLFGEIAAVLIAALLGLVGFFKLKATRAERKAAAAEDQVQGYEAAQLTQDQAEAAIRRVQQEYAKEPPIDPKHRTGLGAP